MSIPTAPEHAPTLPQSQVPPPKRNILLPILAGAAVLAAFFAGSVSNPAPPPVIQVQEKIVEKEVTPESCLTALDLNEEAFSGLSDSMGHVLDENYVAANRSTEKVKALAPKVTAAKLDCRSK